MAENRYLLALIRDLIAHRVKFVVSGSVAVILHGVERLTMDLDPSVAISQENLTRFLKAAEKNKLTPERRTRQNQFWIKIL